MSFAFFFCKIELIVFNGREQAHRGVKGATAKIVDDIAKKLSLLEAATSPFLNLPKIDNGPLGTKDISGILVDLRTEPTKSKLGKDKHYFPKFKGLLLFVIFLIDKLKLL